MTGLSRIKLERRALELGIKRNIIKDKNDIDLKVLIIQKSIEDKHIMTMEIRKIKRRRRWTFLREMSEGENFRINYDQLNPNITIEALRDDLDN